MPYEPQMLKAFADDLFVNGFFEEAAGEYRRYLFSTQEVDEIVIQSLAEIYRQKADNDGIIWLGDNYAKKVSPALKTQLHLMYGKIIFQLHDSEKFLEYYDSLNAGLSTMSDSFQFLFPISKYVLSKNFNETTVWAENASTLDKVFEPLSEQCRSYKHKSSVGAAFLSVFVPGAGRWYTGSFRSGLRSLLTVGSLVSASIYTVNKYGWNNWRPWVFSVLSVGSYSIEIYGAAKSATRYNDYQYRKILEETESLYDKIK